MNRNGNLLSSAELDALTSGIQEGTIDSGGGFNAAAVIKKHDLASEDSSLGVNVSALDMINERFIRLFRPGLLEVLRTSPRISPARVQLTKFGEYLKKLHPPLSVNVIRMNPLRGSSLVLIDPTLVLSTLDNFFGGSGRSVGQLAPTRMFTPTETRVVELILKVFFRSLSEAWQPLMAVDFERVSSEINPQFAQIADENDLVIVNHFEAECGQEKGFIDIVHPYTSLKPIREQLRNRGQSVDGDRESDRAWEINLQSAVEAAPLEMRVVLGQVRTTLRRLNSLREGDVVFFRKFDHALALVNDIPTFDVQVGTSGPSMAVQVRRIRDISQAT
jgi:flagellar motor switch protein FliM